MIDPQLKNKIANTIAKYEEKCEKLKQDVVLLRTAMGHLLTLPAGIHVDFDAHLESLQNDLSDNQPPEVIVQRIEAVMAVMAQIKKQYQKLSAAKGVLPENICRDINHSLLSLIEHLKIPEVFQDKVFKLKVKLNKTMTLDALPAVINQLNELMVDTFELEKSQFKNMLHLLTKQLSDVNSYLKFTSQVNQQAQRDSIKLEKGIESNIKKIQKQVDDSTTIEELSHNIQNNLLSISEGVKEFKQNEQKRMQSYEKKVQTLKQRLVEAERRSSEIQQKLNIQQHQVGQDSLTGLPNRAAYDEQILQAFNRWERGSGDLCLAIGDIDHFKQVNDNYGHLAGDKVLKKLADIFKESLRKVDFVARYGGEEFVFVFENTKETDAFKLVEFLRKKIQDFSFTYQEAKVAVTISFGLTMLTPEDDLEDCFKRADSALYKAKHEGRNQVQVL